MLAKNSRISRKLFKPLLESREYFNSEHFVLRVGPSHEVRVAVTVSKKIARKAVVRNKIKRRVYSVFRKLIVTLKGGLYLVIAKAGSEKIKGEELQNELLRLISLSGRRARSIRN